MQKFSNPYKTYDCSSSKNKKCAAATPKNPPQKAAINVNNSQAQKLKRLKSTGRLRHMHGYILEVIAARQIYFGI